MESAQGWKNVPDRLMASRDAAQPRRATALSLLFFAAPAWAADDSGGTTALIAAAAVQVVIALVVGGMQFGRNRLVQLADERMSALAEEVRRDRASFQAQLDTIRSAIQQGQADVGARISTIREQYVQRAEFSDRLDRLETGLEKLRTDVHGELKEVRGQNAEILGFLQRLGGK